MPEFFSGFEELADEFREFTREAAKAAEDSPEVIDDALEDISEDIAETVKTNIIKQGLVESGLLKGSVYSLKKGDQEYVIGVGAEYGRALEYGRGPFLDARWSSLEITPDSAEALSWISEETGERVYVEKVDDVISPHPFFNPAIDFYEDRAEIEEQIGRELRADWRKTFR